MNNHNFKTILKELCKEALDTNADIYSSGSIFYKLNITNQTLPLTDNEDAFLAAVLENYEWSTPDEPSTEDRNYGYRTREEFAEWLVKASELYAKGYFDFWRVGRALFALPDQKD